MVPISMNLLTLDRDSVQEYLQFSILNISETTQNRAIVTVERQ